MTDAIAVEGVMKDFFAGSECTRALHGIDITARTGELTYLVGESGSGKTTLISIMTGILTPTAGTVRVFDTDVFALAEDERVTFRLNTIGLIFQHYNLLPALTAAENAAVPLIASGAPVRQATDQARDLLGKLGIADQADKPPQQLSGGQQQRVAIARAIVHEPRLIVCDEPTAALDAKTGRRVMDLLREVALSPERAVIIVTHDNRIFDLADRVIEMEDGRIVSDTMQGGTATAPEFTA